MPDKNPPNCLISSGKFNSIRKIDGGGDGPDVEPSPV